MIQILTSITSSASSEQGLQNIYTPISMKVHFIFCLFATILYLIQFYRRGSWHYLLIMAAIDATFVTQTSIGNSSSSIAVLGLVELILLSAAAAVYLKFAKKQKAEMKAAEAAADKENERRQIAEKIQRAKDKKLIDNAFEDDE